MLMPCVVRIPNYLHGFRTFCMVAIFFLVRTLSTSRSTLCSSARGKQPRIGPKQYRIRCTHLARSATRRGCARGAAAKLKSSRDTSFANHYLCLERLAKRRLRTSHPARSAGSERIYDRNTLTSGYIPPLWKSAGAKRPSQPQMKIWNDLITEGRPHSPLG